MYITYILLYSLIHKEVSKGCIHLFELNKAVNSTRKSLPFSCFCQHTSTHHYAPLQGHIYLFNLSHVYRSCFIISVTHSIRLVLTTNISQGSIAIHCPEGSSECSSPWHYPLLQHESSRPVKAPNFYQFSVVLCDQSTFPLLIQSVFPDRRVYCFKRDPKVCPVGQERQTSQCLGMRGL